MFWNVLGVFWNVLECFGSVLECFGSVLECFGMFWECFGMSWPTQITNNLGFKQRPPFFPSDTKEAASPDLGLTSNQETTAKAPEGSAVRHI